MGSLAAAVASSAMAAGKSHDYQLLHATFRTTLALGKPQKQGVDCYSVVSLDDKVPRFEVIVCEIGEQAFARMQQAGARPEEYARSTYLGQSGPGDKKGSRAFVQGPQTSEIYSETMQTKEYLEVFWLERKVGAGMMLAFRLRSAADLKRFEAGINEICSSLVWKL